MPNMPNPLANKLITCEVCGKPTELGRAKCWVCRYLENRIKQFKKELAGYMMFEDDKK